MPQNTTPLENSISVYTKQWYYSCMTFAKKWLADGFTYQSGGVRRLSRVSRNQSNRAWTKISLDKRRFIIFKECGQMGHGTVSSFSGLLSFLSILLTKYKRGSIFLFAIDVNPQLGFNTIPSQGYLQFSRKALKPANHLGPKIRQSKANYGKMRKR